MKDHHESDLDPQLYSPETLSGLINSNISQLNDDLDLPIALRKGVRACIEHPIGNFVSYEKLSPSYQAFVSSIDNIQIPKTIQEALMDPQWKGAVKDEINALVKNGTWNITDLPPGKKSVGCKWVFTVKHRADGSIERYKTRLVAKGFTQSYGIDYNQTFTPVMLSLYTGRVFAPLCSCCKQRLAPIIT